MTESQSATLDGAGAIPAPGQRDGAEGAQPRVRLESLRTVADTTVEGCLLLTAVALPLFFPGGTSMSADGQKSVLLIAIAAIASAAWLLGAVTDPDRRTLRGVSRPLLWSGVAFLSAYALGTMFSIHPLVSFLGTLDRTQGLLTHAAYTALFVCAATRLRDREQVHRLITVLIVGSLPAVAYGLLQQVGIDPLPTTGDPSITQWPVRSSFGNHVFFGAYLVLLIPLTATRVFESLEREEGTPAETSPYALLTVLLLGVLPSLLYLAYLAGGNHHPSLFAVMPLLLAGFTLVGMVLDRLLRASSPPRLRLAAYSLILALQVAVLVMTSARGALLGAFATLPIFALLAAWRLHRPRIAWSVLGCAALAALFVLILNIPTGPLQSLRSVHALNRVADVGGYASESSGAGRLLIWHGFATLMIQHPAIGNTWGGVGRDVVGYGPESQAQAFEAVFPRLLRVETAETYTWDRAHSMYLDILVDAGILALLAFAASIMLFFLRVLAGTRASGARISWLTIGAVCAVAGHLVEGIFGVETAGTVAILWILLGIGAGPVLGAEATQEVPLPRIDWRRPSLLYAAGLAAACGVALLVDLTEHPTGFTTLWLAGLVGGIGAATWMLWPRAAATESDAASLSRPAWAVALACAVAAIVVLSAFVIPWKTESAAIAESAGFKHLGRGDVVGGLADLQQAARTQGYEPKYREDLAVAYFALANRNMQSTDPGYVPAAGDALTIDPGGAQSLGHGQLFALGVQSLKAAESLSPLDPHPHELVGDAYMQSSQWGLAGAEYQQAERLSHDNPRFLDDLGLVALATNHVGTALARAQAAVQLDPTFWYSFYTRALVYDAMQRTDLARADARLALVVVKIYYPPPPASQMATLRRLAQ